MHSVSLRTAPFAAALLLAGCGGGTPHTAGSVPAPARSEKAVPRWPGREEVAKAITLLDQGKEKAARKLLAKVLKHQPADALAGRLIKEIDSDPKALLGSESFAYVSRPQESFAMIAQRFLGDPQLFYALARYNGMAVPSSLKPGTTLRVPGREKRDLPPPPPAPRPQPAPRPAAEAAPPPRAAPVAAATPSPRPAPPVTDPRKAAQLRAAGLEQLNRGAIARAVVLFQQASRLDPANALIRKDLDRAVRIRRTVQNGH